MEGRRVFRKKNPLDFLFFFLSFFNPVSTCYLIISSLRTKREKWEKFNQSLYHYLYILYQMLLFFLSSNKCVLKTKNTIYSKSNYYSIKFNPHIDPSYFFVKTRNIERRHVT